MNSNTSDPKEKRNLLNTAGNPRQKPWFGPLRNKKILGAAIAAAVVLLAAGTASAQYVIKTSVSNHFKAESFEVTLTENFTPPENWEETTGPVAKEVIYNNTGTTPALLRVQMAESWLSQDGEALPNEIMDGGNNKSIVQKNWKDPNGLTNIDMWTFHEGWYYYKKVLQPKGETGDSVQILSSVELNAFSSADSVKDYGKASYYLSFLHEYVKTEEPQNLWAAEAEITDGDITWNFAP